MGSIGPINQIMPFLLNSRRAIFNSELTKSHMDFSVLSLDSSCRKRVLLNTGIHQYIPEYTGIHRNTQEYTGLHVRVYLIINVIMSYVMLDMAKFGVEDICTC